ncbi:FMN reductase [Stenotrophomonas indicatrix]|uniref:FMN reductase n=1 Tax=Stenotrophomonas indicatrix TaxID=2045451 RepID=UPI0010C48A01|nr:FMN reductase [Stenotrophomonas indicatrix]QBR44632.1 NADPH-dependent FMN reductase [Stenotrophomonas indicatrix]
MPSDPCQRGYPAGTQDCAPAGHPEAAPPLLKRRDDPPLRIVAVSGGLQRPSRAATLAEHLLDLIGEGVPCDQHLIELGELAPQLAGALRRSQLPETVERQLAAVERADVLVVVTPVYRGSYTGLFKHFFDFIDQDALVDTPILLAATGGSERHALVIDHQLRPLFSFFQARTLPLGVYATDKDFADGCVQNEALMQRARLAVQRAMPLLALSHRAAPAVTEAAAVL